jgi:PAS domain S-box-containing protein
VNVLYVEDDPLDAELTRSGLAELAPQIKLDIVSSIHEAKACLEQTAYDIVLTDVYLPDGNGLGLLSHIRERGMPLVVILITGAGDEEVAVAALKAGADDYLVKRSGSLVRLPAILDDALERHRAETARLARPLRVLYVEDNTIDIDLTRRHLSRHAPYIHLEAVNTAAEVLGHLGEGGSDHYDVLMLDYQLPGANALELLRELRQVVKSDIPVVLVTGQGNEEIAVQALRLGATDYLVKTTDYLYRLPSALENAFHRTQLAREKAALRQSEARYRVISELTSDFMYSIRIEREGAFALEWQAGALTRITGYSWEELANINWSKLIHPDDRPAYNHHVEMLLSGQSDVAELRVLAKNNEIHWVRNYGRPVWDEREKRVVRLYGAAQDVTAHKQIEEEIRKLNRVLERRAKEMAAINAASRMIASSLDPQEVLKLVIAEVTSLLDAEGVSVLLRDPASGDLFFAAATGPGSEQMAGLRVPVTAGIAGWVMRERRSIVVADVQKDPRFYTHVDAVTGLTTRTLAAVPLKFQAALWGVVEAINKASGPFDERDLEMLEALASTAAIAIENARLYSSIQEANTRLQVALHAKDEMIQNVSHELRTPLGLIYGYIELMEDQSLGPLTDGQEHAIETMHRQGDRLRFMVERLLIMQTFRKEKLRRIKLELKPWIQQVVQPWELRASRAGIRLRLDLPDLPPIMADPDFMCQVLENLLDNALKFSPRNSEMHVRANVREAEVIIAISDQGVGIAREELQRIFDRFYQVDGSVTRRYGGMGIGLALCRAIVEAHGGRIWAESEGHGKGSTFCFTLPLITAEST